MNNQVISQETAELISRVREITEHARVLAEEKKALMSQITASLGDNFGIGTTTFVDPHGSKTVSVKTSQEISAKPSLFDHLGILKKQKLLGTVFIPTFKIDKRAYDRIQDQLDPAIFAEIETKTKTTVEIL